MAFSAATLMLRIGGDPSPAVKALDTVDRKMGSTTASVDRQSGAMGRMFQGIASSAGTIGKVLGGAAVLGVGALAGGLGAAAVSGLGFNSQLENTSAQIQAFTKDGKATADILDMIKDRASKTPFAFNEMSSAAAALLPAAKTSGAALEGMIAQAEILAASNPAQGLEGAAFALKEATGGDFQSAIERFNLPRQYINQLKAEGVPNLEIVSRAMQQMGLDADLVTGLAGTMTGRWSTFKDTLQGLAATATAPLFEGLSSGLGSLQEKLDGNGPALQAFAETVGTKLGSAFQWLVGTGIPGLIAGWQSIKPTVATVAGMFTGTVIPALMQVGTFVTTSLLPPLMTLVDFISAHWQPIVFGMGAVMTAVLLPALAAAAVAAGGLVVAFLPVVAPLIALGAAAALLYEAFQTNFGGIRDIIMPVIESVKAGFAEGGIGGALTALLGQLGTVGPQLLAWFGTVATTIGEQVLTWGSALVAWVSPSIPIVLGKLAELGTSLWTWVSEQAPILTERVTAWGQSFIGWIGPQIPILLARAQELATALWGWVSAQAAPLITQFQTWAGALVAWIVPATVSFLQQWPGFLNEFLDWIGGAALSLGGKLLEWGAAFLAWIGPAIPPFLMALGGIAIALGAFLGETVLTLNLKLLEWGIAFVSWIGTSVLPKLPGALAAIGEAIVTFVGSVASWLGPKIAEWANKFVSWVQTDVLPKLPGALESIKSTVSGWISGALSWLGSQAARMGTAIIDGVKGAISAGAKFITDAIKGALQAALDAAMDFMGIKSPSRVMAEQVGVPIVEGIMQGMTWRQGDLAQRASRIAALAAESAVGALRSALPTTIALPDFTMGTVPRGGGVAGGRDVRERLAGAAAMDLSPSGPVGTAVSAINDAMTSGGREAGQSWPNAFAQGLQDNQTVMHAAMLTYVQEINRKVLWPWFDDIEGKAGMSGLLAGGEFANGFEAGWLGNLPTLTMPAPSAPAVLRAPNAPAPPPDAAGSLSRPLVVHFHAPVNRQETAMGLRDALRAEGLG